MLRICLTFLMSASLGSAFLPADALAQERLRLRESIADARERPRLRPSQTVTTDDGDPFDVGEVGQPGRIRLLARQGNPLWDGQPTEGPGGSNYPHAGYQVTREAARAPGGALEGYEIYEPTDPRPASAPVLIYISSKALPLGFLQQGLFEHVCRKGYVVINPFFDNKDVASGERTIRAALDHHRTRGTVAGDDAGTAWSGFSTGGYLALHFAGRSEELGFGRVRCIVTHDHTSLSSQQEFPNLDEYKAAPIPNLKSIAPDTVVVFILSQAMADLQQKRYDIVYNFVDWSWVSHVNVDRKNFLFVRNDQHGAQLVRPRPGGRLAAFPQLSADHFAVLGRKGLSLMATDGNTPRSPIRIDALDWNAYWRPTVAALDYAFHGTHKEYVIGNAPTVTSMGTWKDGTPITPLLTTTDLADKLTAVGSDSRGTRNLPQAPPPPTPDPPR